jgi:cytoskeletal protein CcmA (bactofilin family)
MALVTPAVAGAATVGGTRGDDPVVVISGDVTVPRGEAVEGVFIASGDATIAGEVEGDVIVLSGDVLVSGRVDGELFTADGEARLLPSAEVTGDVGYGDEHPQIAVDARVHGDVEKQDWPDAGDLFAWVGGFVFWLAISLSLLIFGALLLLIAPRAADALEARSHGRFGPTIAIGIAIAIVLPVASVIAAITLFGLPLAIGIGLSLLPLASIAYLTSAYVLGRRILKPPRHRQLALLAGLVILRALAYVPILGVLVSLAALIFGLGLIGAAIGAARDPAGSGPLQSPRI